MNIKYLEDKAYRTGKLKDWKKYYNAIGGNKITEPRIDIGVSWIFFIITCAIIFSTIEIIIAYVLKIILK